MTLSPINEQYVIKNTALKNSSLPQQETASRSVENQAEMPKPKFFQKLDNDTVQFSFKNKSVKIGKKKLIAGIAAAALVIAAIVAAVVSGKKGKVKNVVEDTQETIRTFQITQDVDEDLTKTLKENSRANRKYIKSGKNTVQNVLENDVKNAKTISISKLENAKDVANVVTNVTK